MTYYYKKLKQLRSVCIFPRMDDRISSLPDEILCYILSFLPTYQVVVSSVLSLDFYCGDIEFDIDIGAYNLFLRSVDSFLYCRDRDQPLHKFCLKFPCGYFVVDMNRWMVAAVSGSGRLQHLDLNLNYNCPIPSFVFCKTLVVLKLTDVLVLDNFFVDLPLLKMLYLNDVMLPKYLDLSHFLCGCPNLEDLEFNDMDCDIKGKINILPKLIRASFNNVFFPLEIFKDVQVLKFDWRYQPNLDLDFDFHNLVQLEMVVMLTKDWLRVLEVLKHSPKLQTLVIYIKKIFPDSFLDEENDWSHPLDDDWPNRYYIMIYPQTVPSCISSQLKSCCLKDYGGCKDEFLFAEYIMENAMYLRTMKICSVWSATREEGLDMIIDLSSRD